MRTRTTRRGVQVIELSLGAAQLGNLYRVTAVHGISIEAHGAHIGDN